MTQQGEDAEDRRSIREVLVVESGSYVAAGEILDQEDARFFAERIETERAIQAQRYRYLCAFCHRPVKVRAADSTSVISHFGHVERGCRARGERTVPSMRRHCAAPSTAASLRASVTAP